MHHKYLRFLRPKAGSSSMQHNVVHSRRAWDQQGLPIGSIWYSDGSLLEARASIGVVDSPMRMQVRVPSPHTIYGAELYGIWIAACLAKPWHSIVLDNRAKDRCVSKPPSPQSSVYDLHDRAYHLITTKSLQVRRARGHKGPQKEHSLRDNEDMIGNELAYCMCSLRR